MKIKDLVEKHGDLELSEEVLKQLGIEVKVHKFEEPKVWENYYYINTIRVVDCRTNTEADIDKILFSVGNYYPEKHFTLEEVEQIARQKFEYDKAIWELKREIERLNDGWLPDWSDPDEPKFYICYDYAIHAFDYDTSWNYHSRPECLLLKSSELCERIIKTHSKQLKTYLGIKR